MLCRRSEMRTNDARKSNGRNAGLYTNPSSELMSLGRKPGASSRRTSTATTTASSNNSTDPQKASLSRINPAKLHQHHQQNTEVCLLFPFYCFSMIFNLLAYAQSTQT